MGLGTNNFAKLSVIRLLLWLASKYHINYLHIFGDSQIVIRWVNEDNRIYAIQLIPLLDETLRLKILVNNVYIKHIYRERNIEADSLAKEGIDLDDGQWIITGKEDEGSILFIRNFYAVG